MEIIISLLLLFVLMSFGNNDKTSKDKQTGDGGVSTKTDKNKEISKKFIEDMFRIDDSDF